MKVQGYVLDSTAGGIVFVSGYLLVVHHQFGLQKILQLICFIGLPI